MKRLMVGVFAALMLGSNLAQGQDIQLSAGLHTWFNSWEQKYKSGNSIEADNAVMMIGPTVSIKNDNAFAGITILGAASDYKFSFASGNALSYSRRDIDLVGGYMFTPKFGIFVGYKSLTAKQKYSPYYALQTKIDWGTWKLSGPGLGITGHIPLNNTTVFYGRLGIMALKKEWREDENATVSFSEDVSGAALELGIAFSLSEKLTANAGIKSQAFVSDNTEDAFGGLTLGGNYRF